ncbi:centrosomal protein kizuna [Erythrolamprus reginae]|uniref:centrosomal protein kizuna n=1 Tax=Erythrolamprus reginae TaxID=121349 RepID=UPI00396C3802
MAGNVCGAGNSTVAGCDKGDYDEQIRRIQAQLRHSESKRVELERRMLEYSTSDTSRTELKYTNLKKYLNEICERQKKSLLRNQDLLKEFDCLEAHINNFASRSESLQKLKAEYEKDIKNRLLVEKKDTLKREMRDATEHQMIPEARQSGINDRTAMSRGLYHTATIFMGRQMSAVSNAEDFSALQKSQLTKSFSISDLHSYRQPSQSCYMTDSCVVQTNSDLQYSNKSDKIDGETSLLKGEEMPVTSSVSYENEITSLIGESITNNDSNNFVENNVHPEPKSLLHTKLSSENRSTSLKSYSCCKSLTPEHSLQSEQGTKKPISLIVEPGELVSASECSEEKFPVLRSTMHLDKNVLQEEDKSLSSSTDLTVSLSEEEEESNHLKLKQNLNSTDCKPDDIIYNEECSPIFFSTEHSSSGPKLRGCLSFEGFCYVLTFIEEMVAKLPSGCSALYQRGTANTAELKELISLCNKGGNLAQENFEACEALVLYQLQKLLQNTMNGSLLSSKKPNDKKEKLNEEQSRSELESYFLKIWKRLNHHIIFLQMHHILLREEVKDMFSTLLISKSHNKQESPSSLELNVEEGEDISFSCNDKTSCNSPVKNNPEKQGLNIKEQKSNGTSSEPSFSSLERKSSLSRGETQRGVIFTVKSKAFWGESDDSNSDIEAALRPQEHCSQEDGFSDFYD